MDRQAKMVAEKEKKVTHKYLWQQQVIDGPFYFYVFLDTVYRVGTPKTFCEMNDEQKECNAFCATKFAEDAGHICDLLNNELTIENVKRTMENLVHQVNVPERRSPEKPFVNRTKKVCPNCGKEYFTELERPAGDRRCIQDIFPDEPAWKREQLLSGICSDACWKEYLGVAPE